MWTRTPPDNTECNIFPTNTLFCRRSIPGWSNVILRLDITSRTFAVISTQQPGELHDGQTARTIPCYFFWRLWLCDWTYPRAVSRWASACSGLARAHSRRVGAQPLLPPRTPPATIGSRQSACEDIKRITDAKLIADFREQLWSSHKKTARLRFILSLWRGINSFRDRFHTHKQKLVPKIVRTHLAQFRAKLRAFCTLKDTFQTIKMTIHCKLEHRTKSIPKF